MASERFYSGLAIPNEKWNLVECHNPNLIRAHDIVSMAQNVSETPDLLPWLRGNETFCLFPKFDRSL